MTQRSHQEAPSDSLVALLQPYIDGELDEAMSAAALARLDADPELRLIVEEQRAARSALRAAPRESAPAGLRARLLLDLDAVDHERAVVAAPTRSGWPRARALLRGAVVMMPAAAAAALLFVALRAGAPALDADAPAPSLAAVDPATDDAADRASPVLPPLDMAPRVLGAAPGAAPTGVTLVGLGDAAAPSEVEAIEYELGGGRILELRRPALRASREGDEIRYRGDLYQLRRDPRGRAVVVFIDGAVEHTLVVAALDPREIAPGSEQRLLLELGHRLRHGSAR